jgi:hypothetical protein
MSEDTFNKFNGNEVFSESIELFSKSIELFYNKGVSVMLTKVFI